MTHATQAVLRTMLDAIPEPMYGLDICHRAGLASGTIHPILARFELEHHWLESYLEDIDPSAAGRAARRYYHFTEDGAVAARQALAEASAKAAARTSVNVPGLGHTPAGAAP